MRNRLNKLSLWWITTVIVWVIGISLRVYHWGFYSFGFDQVQILQNAEQIIHGKLTLIGPRTGPASMFTGPLIYYWTAGFYLFNHSPYSLIASTIVLTSLTGLILWGLGRRYMDEASSFMLVCLWACAQILVQVDRMSWNPNLLLMAASLVYFPLSKIFTDMQLTRLDKLLVFMGIFLGYQAHFTGLFLFPIALLAVIWRRRQDLTLLFGMVGSFTVSLVPTILFDRRHNWLNLHGLLGLLQNQSAAENQVYPHGLGWIFRVAMETIGKVILVNSSTQIWIGIGIAVFVLYGLAYIRIRKVRWLWPLLWCGVILIIFSFYRGRMPEYYFLIFLPAIFMIIVSIMQSLRLTRWMVLLIFSIYISLNSFLLVKHYVSSGELFIKEQVEASRFAALHQNYRSIHYDLPIGLDYGLKYLNTTLSMKEESVKALHFIYPSSASSSGTLRLDNLNVWIEQL